MVKDQKNKSKNSLCFQQVEDFIRHLKVEKNYAVNTVNAYRRDLEKLLRFIERRGVLQWRDIDEKLLNIFVMELRHANTSSRSIRRNLSSTRVFFSHLIYSHLMSENPAERIVSPRLNQDLPKTIDFEQINKMTKLRSSRLGELRDVAMIELMYSCALRVSELVGINTTDLDASEGFVKILGKGAKVRYAPVGQGAIEAIGRYLSRRPVDKSEAMFVNQKQTRISVRSVQNIVKKRALDAGIAFNVHPHMIRHAAATHFLQSSHDLRSVQELLGHKSIKSTQVYTHLDFLELSKVYDDCHPRAKK